MLEYLHSLQTLAMMHVTCYDAFRSLLHSPPPNILPSKLINIHTCSTDRCDHSVYYVRPPKNGIASYAYVVANLVTKVSVWN